MEAYQVQIKGLVQGVGFRPFIYRLATKHDLKGSVENRNDCVQILLFGRKSNIDRFLFSVRDTAPEASNIESVDVEKIEYQDYTDFRIISSRNISEAITEISPDIAVCEECIRDMKEQANRINYPFINCTNCGPRFTIIKDLPYDRESTTMKPFVMCEECKNEYTNVLDRRFHAQPVACSNCGPHYELIFNGNTIKDTGEIIKKICELINSGKIIAVKGLGGFHIACDAFNEEAVSRLRELKNREAKPFAVMFSDINKLKKYADVNSTEEKILLSWRRPILILQEKTKLADSVSVSFPTIGTMLPYMPLHYLLFEQLETPAIVLTSGNISNEPIIIDNNEANKVLSKISDVLLVYNRDIYNRTDDSVIMVVNDKERLIRRSRGYAPSPIRMEMDVDGIIATGAELVNCFCLGKENQAIMSQHIGDLKNLETLEFYEESINQFIKLFRVKPNIIACDKHPDYLSTKYAESSGLKTIYIQHHHAHIASCMAENKLDEKVIGVSFDGTGYGDDAKIWGGEFFICDLNEYERYTHFDYIPIPGGDKAVEEPWRMGVSYLYKTYGEEFYSLDLPFLQKINRETVEIIVQAIKKGINCPETSSAGRLFDAVTAIINLCTISGFHAEAPMRLESVIDKNCKDLYEFDINKTIDVKKTIRGIVNDIKNKVPVSLISAKFHNTIISIIFAVVKEISLSGNIMKVVISGGTFQNKYILENLEKLLIKNKYEVYSNRIVPSNDGGIALGQLAITAKRKKLKCV